MISSSILYTVCLRLYLTILESKVVVVFETLIDYEAALDLDEGRTSLQLSFVHQKCTWSPDLSNASLKRGASTNVRDQEVRMLPSK